MLAVDRWQIQAGCPVNAKHFKIGRKSIVRQEDRQNNDDTKKACELKIPMSIFCVESQVCGQNTIHHTHSSLEGFCLGFRFRLLCNTTVARTGTHTTTHDYHCFVIAYYSSSIVGFVRNRYVQHKIQLPIDQCLPSW